MTEAEEGAGYKSQVLGFFPGLLDGELTTCGGFVGGAILIPLGSQIKFRLDNFKF